MIEENIVELFEKTGHTWKIGGRHLAPDEEDVRKVLDKAVANLYDGQAGDQFTLSGLIIEKTQTGYEVYVSAGTYY